MTMIDAIEERYDHLSVETKSGATSEDTGIASLKQVFPPFNFFHEPSCILHHECLHFTPLQVHFNLEFLHDFVKLIVLHFFKDFRTPVIEEGKVIR